MVGRLYVTTVDKPIYENVIGLEIEGRFIDLYNSGTTGVWVNHIFLPPHGSYKYDRIENKEIIWKEKFNVKFIGEGEKYLLIKYALY